MSDERLKDKDEGSTRLRYTGLRGGLEHLKIYTRLTDERFATFRRFETGDFFEKERTKEFEVTFPECLFFHNGKDLTGLDDKESFLELVESIR